MSSSSEKRCLYEVLGLSRDCTADEIRSAYRRLALQRHPDKLVRSGVPEAEATASFQELVNAYEVLSDTQERKWYDSHRNQILFSSTSGAGGSSSFVPDLFPFFSNSVYSGYSDSGRGFYKVFGDLFEKIFASELTSAKKLGFPLPKEAPLMGKLESPYVQVTAFYNYWLGFTTVLDFFWADQYDAMTGPNRKSRRVMEDENKKSRKKARREYNETVRGLTEFVKKRDKRVIDMQLKRNAEMEKKREEEKQRKKEMEREKAEKARNYEEPEWAKVDEVEDNESEDAVEEKRKEFYCVVCSKKFKSDKQWRNHEQSKKHKEKVAELREAFSEEDKEYEKASEGNKSDANVEICVDYLTADDNINELMEQFKANSGIQKDESDDGKIESSNADEVADINSNNGGGSDDDETSILEAMLSGHKSRTKLSNRRKAQAKKVEVEIDSDELEFMEYNDIKTSRRNRGGRRRRARRQEEDEEEKEKEKEKEEKEKEKETTKADVAERYSEAEEPDEQGEEAGEPSSHPLPPESGTKIADDATDTHHKHSKQAAKKKSTTKKENISKPKVAPKGRKGKAAANGSDNMCQKCGEEFESRTKLHKHLGDTGHASLKSR
ncbi:hypothetical protein CASFOL_001079 [Castilleja foliolosa]|uniref:Uncharacterized protein n=1 Tax=Castilleja foliolosa TaxID=1961234 RepID=A0ABD3ELT1_9LAMI